MSPHDPSIEMKPSNSDHHPPRAGGDANELRFQLTTIANDVDRLSDRFGAIEAKLAEVVASNRATDGHVDRLSERVATTSKLLEVENDVQSLRDEMVRTRTLVEHLNSRPTGWTEVGQKLETTTDRFDEVARRVDEMSRRVEGVDKRTPSVAQWLGAILAVVAFLGFDIFQSWNNAAVVNSVGTKLQESANKIDTIKDSVARQMQEIGPKLDSVQKSVANAEITAKALDRTLVSLVQTSQAVSASTPTGAEPSKEAPSSDDNSVTGLFAELARQAGSQLPKYISLSAEARQAYEKGNYAEARQLATRAKDQDPNRANGFYDGMIAQSYIREGKYADAIKSFDTSLALEPDNSTTLNNIGSAYFAMSLNEPDAAKKKGYLHKSVDYLERAAKLETTSAAVAANLAVSLNELGKHNEALQAVDAYTGPKSSTVEYARACTYAMLNQTTPAIASLATAFETDRSLVLHAIVDSDLESLRPNPAFRSLLEKHADPKFVKAAVEHWSNSAKKPGGSK